MLSFDPPKGLYDPPTIHPGWIVLLPIYGGPISLEVFGRFGWITGSQRPSTSGKSTIHPTIHPDPPGWIILAFFGLYLTYSVGVLGSRSTDPPISLKLFFGTYGDNCGEPGLPLLPTPLHRLSWTRPPRRTAGGRNPKEGI